MARSDKIYPEDSTQDGFKLNGKNKFPAKLVFTTWKIYFREINFRCVIERTADALS